MVTRRDTRRKVTGVGLALCLVARLATAQPGPDTTFARVLTETLEALDPEDVEATAVAELLAHLAAAPLDLNTARAEDLALLPFITLRLARQIVQHRVQQGPFATVDALGAVPGIDLMLLDRLRPFVAAGATTLSSTSSAWRVEALQRYTRRMDADTSGERYPGGPARLYTRLHARTPKLRMHLTLDQDPGEPFAWAPHRQTYGFDFVSASVQAERAGPFERVVVGDFTVETGQGLVLWRGAAFGKGREPVRTVARAGRGIRAYSGSDEYRYFRGVASSIRVHPLLTAAFFASHRRLDATLDTLGAPASGIYARSLPTDGLHRTARERARKAVLAHDLVGGLLHGSRGALEAGISGYVSRFAHPLEPGPLPYRQFGARGRGAAVAGAFFHYLPGPWHLYGEAARTAEGPTAGLAGLAFTPARGLEAAVAARYFPRGFTSLFGHVFGEQGGTPQNETGLYAGLRMPLGRTATVSAFHDQYRFPWLRYGVPRPSRGHEVLVQVEHRPRRWLTYYALARSETREQGVDLPGPDGRILDAVARSRRASLRLHGTYVFSDALELRARVEGVATRTAGGPAGRGLLLYQDVRWRPTPRLRLDARLAFFDTDGYNPRVYVYEDDVRYAFSIPALSGRGLRQYALLHFTPSRALLLQLRVAETIFEAYHDGEPDTARRTVTVQARYSR